MDGEAPAPAALTRAPQQGRSRASYERMVAAAEALMRERGSDEFTLNEVAQRGQVSIGSIYNRFDSKDVLIHVVQEMALATMDLDQQAVIVKARESAGGLDALIRELVDGIAETLRKHAEIMRPLMLRATNDPVVALAGKKSYIAAESQVRELLLSRREEIRHPDPERAVSSSYRIMYAAIARYLGFGSSTTAAWEGDWALLKEDLGRMCSAFLRSPA